MPGSCSQLGKSPGWAKPTAETPSKPTPGSPSDPVRCETANKCTITKAYFDKMVASPSAMQSQATIVPAPGGGFAQNITLRVGAVDIVMNQIQADEDISITTAGNLLDDAVETTAVVAGDDIFLTTGGRVGGFTPLTTADILSASTATPSDVSGQ